MNTSRYTFHKPTTIRGALPASTREVRENGQPIGLLNRVFNGYVIRDLDGHKLDTVYVADRVLAAGILSQEQERRYREATWGVMN